MPDSAPRDPHTFVSQVLASWARESESELKQLEQLEQIAELTKSPCVVLHMHPDTLSAQAPSCNPRVVDQDILNAQLFNLPDVSQWQYKRNVIRARASLLSAVDTDLLLRCCAQYCPVS